MGENHGRTSHSDYPGSRFLVTAAAFVVVSAGMKAAAGILVPFLLSAFLACICAIPMTWLQRKGFPSWLAVMVVVAGFLVVFSAMGGLVGSSLDSFFKALPGYQSKLRQDTAAAIEWLRSQDIEISNKVILEQLDPGAAMSFVGGLFSAMTAMLTNAFMIFVTMVFILLEVSSFPKRLRRAVDNPEVSLAQLKSFTDNLNRYLAIKTAVSIMTAVILGVWLLVLDVDFPILWALFVFLLNYIPNLGSVIAAAPPVLLGLVQHGPGTALAVLVGFAVVNTIMGNFVEPRYMGEGLGLSTLVVFLSLAFWGWILGPVGMLLSVPLTMTAKIALESSEDLRWVAVLLGPAAPSQPAASKRAE